MRISSRFGLTSLWFGGVALPIVLVATHAERSRVLGSAVLLNWLDAHGFVKERKTGVAELSNPTIFVFTDEIAIRWVLIYGVCFACYAVLLALWAEFKQEDTLYLSAGFMCGILALSMTSLLAGAIAALVGTALLTSIRRRIGA